MRQLSTTALALIVSLVAAQGVAHAVGKGVETTLPIGQIACNNLKNAMNYQQYIKSAPDFAADLIQRAACFKVESELQAVQLSSEKGFDKLKILTGHTVWVPSVR